MRKLLAIIRREYVQGVRSKAFVISTVLAPVFMAFFMIVPALLVGLKTGGATRVAVFDQTGRLYEHVRESILSGDRDDAPADASKGAEGQGQLKRGVDEDDIQTRFEIEQVAADGAAVEEVRKRLNERVLKDELDAYLILPADVLTRGEAQLYARNTGDVFTTATLENRLSRAVIEQRMRDANIDRERVRELSREVRVETSRVTKEGEQKDEGGAFFFALAVGSFILIAILMYGQAILSAVVEEKTTRIVEVLFSSVRAFTLLAGKLVGVSLVAMTQFAIWVLMLVALAVYGAASMPGGGAVLLPKVPPQALLYALLFFMLGFFVYATIYSVIGSIVTTEKEASQIVVPVSFLPVIAIYLAFPVIRSPNSAFSFWVSMVPFFSPVTMLVRVVTETPPFWQIALSFLIGVATVVLMVWFAARVYRTAMLMYGKRATLPEIWRWARQE